MKKITDQNEFPKEKHYAIIIFDKQTIYHEGDQRSKDFPGHGYPAHTETVNNFQYLAFFNTEEWEKKIDELFKEKPKRTDVVAFISEGKKEIKTITTIA